MANKKNKVKFNIRNVHYAKLTIGEDGSITYSTPVAMPGAVSLSLDPNGEPSVFYADGYAYYTISNNQRPWRSGLHPILPRLCFIRRQNWSKIERRQRQKLGYTSEFPEELCRDPGYGWLPGLPQNRGRTTG